MHLNVLFSSPTVISQLLSSSNSPLPISLMDDSTPHPTPPPPPAIAPLSRSVSEPVRRTLQGIPTFMVRRAAAVVGLGEEKQKQFILANVDQPASFWISFKDRQVATATGVKSLQASKTTFPAQPPPSPLRLSRLSLSSSEEGVRGSAPPSIASTAWVDAMKIQPAFDFLEKHHRLDSDDGGVFLEELQKDDL